MFLFIRLDYRMGIPPWGEFESEAHAHPFRKNVTAQLTGGELKIPSKGASEVYRLIVSPNTVPNPSFTATYDFECGDRAFGASAQSLNLAQDSISILGHGELAEGGIGDRYRARRNLVDEIGPGRGLHGYVELKAISFLICRYQVPNSREAQAARAPLGRYQLSEALKQNDCVPTSSG
jgi:hypothetical protein